MVLIPLGRSDSTAHIRPVQQTAKNVKTRILRNDRFIFIGITFAISFKTHVWPVQNNRFIQIALRPDQDTFHHLTNCVKLRIIASSAA
jgi:hypothetical protein